MCNITNPMGAVYIKKGAGKCVLTIPPSRPPPLSSVVSVVPSVRPTTDRSCQSVIGKRASGNGTDVVTAINHAQLEVKSCSKTFRQHLLGLPRNAVALGYLHAFPDTKSFAWQHLRK
jgi:hypothetical protein